MVKPQHEYKNILKPSVEYLEHCGRLMLNIRDMAAFLTLPVGKVQQSINSGRIPLPVRFGNCRRWSVLELLEWVEAGCPILTEWVKQRGGSGWTRWR
ncbi:hypothetical protein AYO44_06860 [Planctomycetaceae bacterium SCGC AG-212-F19]|nr:hypothetical protein AYO44_06860 [Planctomycetaceae bacterium SCGC AG-212-F19]